MRPPTQKLIALFIVSSMFLADVVVALELEEIVVTARKRTESALEIPVSVQAFSTAELKASGVAELEDLAAFSPGLDYQSLGGSQAGRFASELRFRGMNTDQLIPINTTGAFLVDGISIGAGAQSIGYADVERVEIIRGPQPVYFGRGTFGGAANYISKDPGEEFSFNVSTEYSPTFGSHNLSASVDGPLIDGVLGGRLTLSSVKKGAMFHARGGGSLGEERTDAINGTLLFTPNDRLRIKTRFTYSEDDDGAASTTYVPFTGNSNCLIGTPVSFQTDAGPTVGALGRDYVCGDLPTLDVSNNTDFYTVNGFTGPIDSRDVLLNPNNPSTGTPSISDFGLKAEFINVSITADYDLTDSLTISALYGHNNRELSQIRDADGTDSEGWITYGFLNVESESAEIRLSFDDGGRIRGLVGVSYFDSEAGGDLDGGFTLFSNVFGGAFSPPPSTEDGTIETIGFFAAVEFDITDQISLALEGRYQDEEKVDGLSSVSGPTIFGDPVNVESFDPRVILSYAPTESTTLYASYSEGTLPGQVNTALLDFTPAELAAFEAAFPGIPASLDEEEVTNIEFGWKQQFKDINAWFAISVYMMEWENMKSSAAIPFTTARGAVTSVRLEGSSELNGLEFEANWTPTPNLNLHLALGYTDATYDDFANSTFNSILGVPAGSNFKADGNTLPRSPEFSGSLSTTYFAPAVGEWEPFVRADVIHNGESYIDASNLATIEGYQLLNLRFGLSKQDDTMGVEVYCRNCTDEDGWKTGRRILDLSPSDQDPPNFFNRQGSMVQPLDRREIGLRFNYDFN